MNTTDITTWKPTGDWASIDDTRNPNDWLWYDIVPCSEREILPPYKADDNDPHFYTEDGNVITFGDDDHDLDHPCEEQDHGLTIGIALSGKDNGFAVMYEGSTPYFIMDESTARHMVEHMSAEAAYAWAIDHSVPRSWGMPYYLSETAEAALTGKG